MLLAMNALKTQQSLNAHTATLKKTQHALL